MYLDGYTWYVYQCKDENGNYAASAERIYNSVNIATLWDKYTMYMPGCPVAHVYTVNACKTKKEALELARQWNNMAMEQGRYYLTQR